jgi:hypothetical protein
MSLFRSVFSTDTVSSPSAVMLTAAAIGVVTGAMAVRLSLLLTLAGGVLVAAGAGTGLASAGAIPWSVGASLTVTALMSGAIAHVAGARASHPIVQRIARHRMAARFSMVLVVLALIQLIRLGAFVCDQETDWFAGTRHAFWYKHMCLPAYIYGAELNERDDPNIYLADHYIGLKADAKPETRFAMSAEDPYQYPPPFLLLPRAVIALVGDYQIIYSFWYALQLSLIVLVALWLAGWVGGLAGEAAALLIPATLLAFPTLYPLQFGQFHLTAVALSITAMLSFERGRNAFGGALLGFALLAKIFPGALLLWLAVKRKWSAVGWTLGAAAGLTLISVPVVGMEAYRAFFAYLLPQMASGAAIAFEDAWPDFREFVITDNQSYFGIVLKLGALGIAGMTKDVASQVGTVVTVAIALVIVLAARRSWESPSARAVAWLSVLGLASMTSPGGWGDYISFTFLWLAPFLVIAWRRERPLIWLLAVAWPFQFLALGTMPIFGWFSLPVMAGLSLVGALSLHAVFVVGLLGPHPASEGA